MNQSTSINYAEIIINTSTTNYELMEQWGYTTAAIVLILIGFVGFFFNIFVIILMCRNDQVTFFFFFFDYIKLVYFLLRTHLKFIVIMAFLCKNNKFVILVHPLYVFN